LTRARGRVASRSLAIAANLGGRSLLDLPAAGETDELLLATLVDRMTFADW